nr:MAG TPA: hypothetical protein [Myoviridae sp. ct3tv2]DAR21239.1 MAG TPA: hypothetical protein [Caudoviricetes sp.]
MANYNLPQRLSLPSEEWELVKNASDPSVGFPFDRVNTIDFDCSEVRQGLYRILVTGTIMPAPGSLEKPIKLVFIGFNNTPIYQQFLVRNDLRKMSIYKADIGKFSTDFTRAFLGKSSEESKQYDIKPYPEGVENDGTGKNDDA